MASGACALHNGHQSETQKGHTLYCRPSTKNVVAECHERTMPNHARAMGHL